MLAFAYAVCSTKSKQGYLSISIIHKFGKLENVNSCTDVPLAFCISVFRQSPTFLKNYIEINIKDIVQ